MDSVTSTLTTPKKIKEIEIHTEKNDKFSVNLSKEITNNTKESFKDITTNDVKLPYNEKFTYDILFTDKILISTGIYSTVFKVRNVKTNEYLAAKVYNSKFSEEFFLELCILNKCDHPNILKLKYVDLNSFTMYFNYYETTLQYYIFKNSYDLNTQNKWIKQLLLAIDYLHSNNICHFDLKLENILLDKNCNIIIADFSISKICLSSSYLPIKLSKSICTLSYRPTELFNSTLKYFNVYKIDIWSMGIIILLILLHKTNFSWFYNPESFFYKHYDQIETKLKNYINTLEYIEHRQLLFYMLTSYDKRLLSRDILNILYNIPFSKYTFPMNYNVKEEHWILLDNWINEIQVELKLLPSVVKKSKALLIDFFQQVNVSLDDAQGYTIVVIILINWLYDINNYYSIGDAKFFCKNKYTSTQLHEFAKVLIKFKDINFI